ncbi:hypothetical protein [Massilia sp. DD77]|uniref:hypothetical protein n=1 Tax=Massilia sp. DD77 TaxID=3109349 RepID=UPI0030009285
MKELVLVAAIGAAVYLVVQKQAQARAAANPPALAGGGMTAAQLQAAGVMYTPEQRPATNINGEMWGALLGAGWKALSNSMSNDSDTGFTRNWYGQLTTMDGKPVSESDSLVSYSDPYPGLLESTYETDYLGMISPFDAYLDGGQDQMGW